MSASIGPSADGREKGGGGGLRGVERERRVCVCDREGEREILYTCVSASIGPSADGRENGALLTQQR